MKRLGGFTLIELIMIVAVLGILLGIGLVRFSPERTAVAQASKIVAAQVTRTRFEALRRNEPVGLELASSGSGSYRIFEDSDRNNVYSTGDALIESATFGAGDFGRTTLALAACGGAAASDSATILFNGRGFYAAAAPRAIQIGNRAGSYARYVKVSPQGRAEISGSC